MPPSKRTSAEVALENIDFAHASATQSLFTAVSARLPRGFTGVLGANGAGKSTLLKLIAGELTPNTGRIVRGATTVRVAQRTDSPPLRFSEFLADWDNDAFILRGLLAVEEDFARHWERLSHGERKRAQIATALWQAPEVLLLDEPTNHIDASAYAHLRSALQRFTGVGILVSHDRALLDALCQQCLWLEPPAATLYPGTYSDALAQRELHALTAAHKRERLKRAQTKMKRELARRKDKAARADAKNTKRGLDRNDSDAKSRINLVRLTGKDGQAGRLARQLAGRSERLAAELAESPVKKDYADGIWLSGAVTRRKFVLNVDAGTLRLNAQRVLRYPPLVVHGQDRIALTGDNGSGKSSLLALLLRQHSLPSERVLHLPQELSTAQSQELLDSVRALPRQTLGRVLNIVSCLGSRPERLLESALPSPGEVRKLLLALGMSQEPHWLILDEPTNHLDLPSIKALEAALVECPCALLIVSHDTRLLAAVAEQHWHIELSDATENVLSVGLSINT